MKTRRPTGRWDSAGRLTDTGYAVEIRLPLQSIRFKGGDEVRMGLLFWRRVSRSGMSVAWPPLEPGAWVFDRHASLRFDRARAAPGSRGPAQRHLRPHDAA